MTPGRDDTTAAADTRYAEVSVRVYADDNEDRAVTPLQRALHAELCRTQPHSSVTSAWPACWRAEKVVRTMAALNSRGHPVTAATPGRGELGEQIAADLATMLAKRRTNGAVYMGGEHNPHPGEIRAARDFVRDFVQVHLDPPKEET